MGVGERSDRYGWLVTKGLTPRYSYVAVASRVYTGGVRRRGDEAMENPTAAGALAWLDSGAEVIFVPDSVGLKPTVPVIKRGLQLRAEHGSPVLGDMWWLVNAPVLAIPSGIVTDYVLALSGRDLGRCRLGDEPCLFDRDGRYPLAALLYYEGWPADGPGACAGAPNIAGYTALVRHKGSDPVGIRLLAIHVSPAGVRFGYRVDDDVVQMLHDAEVGAFPMGGWQDLRYAPAHGAAEEASRSLHGLARHVQM